MSVATIIHRSDCQIKNVIEASVKYHLNYCSYSPRLPNIKSTICIMQIDRQIQAEISLEQDPIEDVLDENYNSEMDTEELSGHYKDKISLSEHIWANRLRQQMSCQLIKGRALNTQKLIRRQDTGETINAINKRGKNPQGQEVNQETHKEELK